MAGISGISSYQQTNSVWKNNQEKNKIDTAAQGIKNAEASGTGKGSGDVKVSEWKPVSPKGPLVPTVKDGYGAVIGDAKLSDEARDYYNKLKNKFHGMDFILVSKDVKSQVAARASSYGNANKPVVLIDDEKLERMATDESFRKKYEGLIAMSQTKLQEAKNSLVSSGANVRNFGMSVSEDGKTSFFAAVQKAGDAQTKRLEKKQAAKKEEKVKEKKNAEKKEKEERFEKRREANRSEKYVEISSDSVEDLIETVSKYASGNAFGSVLTQEESRIGRNFDFRG